MTYEDALYRLALDNPNIVVMTAENRAAIRNLPPKLGPRFIDVGIAEQTLIGAAAGLALRGKIPVVHALSAFLTMRAFEFIRTDVGIPGLPVKLVGSVAGFLSEANGPTHQALEDVALMRVIPNMQIYCPSDEADLLDMLPSFVESKHPAYLRFNASKSVLPSHARFSAGKAEVFVVGIAANDRDVDTHAHDGGPGHDHDHDHDHGCDRGHNSSEDGGNEGVISIITYGPLLAEALRAADILRESHRRTVRVVHMRTLSPVDTVSIADVASHSRLIVTLEDHFVVGGLYSIVAETLLPMKRTPRVVPLAMGQSWFKPSLYRAALTHAMFDAESIARRVAEEL
ncbi:MAG: transketolase [Deltaproteobacteria bacterium]|nr:transketolase [Deltaproteobacteria bacterium]